MYLFGVVIIQNQSKMVALGEMIGNIAHQWRQPLSAIKTNISGIQLQNDFGILKSEDLDRYCNLAKVQIDYLSTIIEDFRNFINNTNERSKFSLSEIFKTFENLMTSTIKENNINLNIFIEKDMIINLYKNEINQCLINIFNNSKDAFEQNNIKRKEVRFSIKVENNQLIIVLQDNAGGIEEKIIDKIFEPYFTTKHQAVGTGLGLNIVYRLITECMKGTISASNENLEIDNQIYKGTKLTITIPIEPIN